MKGLLLKDFYNMTKSFKTMALILIFYGIFGIVIGQSTMISAMIAIFCATLPLSSFSFDEFAKWDIYALSMPISRKSIILVKYLLGLIVIAVGLLFAVLTGLISLWINGLDQEEFVELLAANGAVGVLCLFVIAILYPVVIRFGVEKARIVMIATFLLPTLLVFLLMKLPKPLWLNEISLEQLLIGVTIAAPILALLSLVLSVCVSLRFYNAKEF